MGVFEELFTEDTAEKLSLEIIKKIKDQETIIDYDFNISKGKMVGDTSDPDANTWIKFDTNKSELMKKVIDTLADESIEPTEERKNIFLDFRKSLMSKLSSDYKSQFTDALRNAIFENKITVEMCPMEHCEVLESDIADVPLSSKYLLKIKKINYAGSIPEYISQPIYEKLMEIETEKPDATKEELQDLLNEYIQDQQKNNKWLFVKSVELCHGLFEYQLDVFVDYTMKNVETK